MSTTTQSQVQPAPQWLALPDGNLAPQGCFLGKVNRIDTSVLDASWVNRRFKRKMWYYFGAYDEDMMLGVAMADVGYTAKAFTYFYDIRTGKFIEEGITLPWGFAGDFQPDWLTPWNIAQGRKAWHFSPQEAGWKLNYEGKRVRLQMEIDEPHHGLSAIAPGRPINFTYKNAALPLRLKLEADGKTFEKQGPIGVMDLSKGYPPRRTVWNWVSMAGTTDDGRSLGINLVEHHNLGLENGLWLDGKLYPLALAKFTVGNPPDKADWTVRTVDEIVSLNFQPLGARRENINLGLASSNFIQPFGNFDGVLQLEGQRLPFTGYGVVEDHKALW